MKKVVLVSCSKKKVPHRGKAKDLYISPLFAMSMKYAESLKPDAIFILSAKHWLLELDTEVDSYNVSIHDLSKDELRRWAEQVIVQLGAKTNLQTDHFIFLTGAEYYKHLTPQMKSFELPLQGLGIGKRLAFLKK